MRGTFSHFDFRVARAPREILDSMAVVVSRGKIHLGKVAAVAENFVHQADALKEFLPIKCRSQAHAGDDVAHCDAHGCLPLVLGADNFVGGSSLCGQAFIEPKQNGAHLWIQVAQALDELHGKRRSQRRFLKTAEDCRLGHQRLAAGAKQTVGQHVGFLARGSAAHDPLR